MCLTNNLTRDLLLQRFYKLTHLIFINQKGTDIISFALPWIKTTSYFSRDTVFITLFL
jgi:hypothetical protein